CWAGFKEGQAQALASQWQPHPESPKVPVDPALWLLSWNDQHNQPPNPLSFLLQEKQVADTSPRPVQPTPPTVREEITLESKGGVYLLPVQINGVLTLHFILDTGASEVNIPADVVLTLHRAGTIRDTDFLPGKTYTLADGSTVKSSRFLLRSLKIGKRRVANV